VNELDIVAAAKAFVMAAGVLLRPRYDQTEPLVWRGRGEWQRINERAFSIGDREEPLWVVCMAENREALRDLPEYRELIVALRRDPVTRPQVDAKMGTAFAYQELSADECAIRPLWRTARRSDSREFDEQVVNEECLAFQREIYATEVEFVAIAPLVDLDAERLPVTLDNNLRLDAMTDAEVARALDVGVLRRWPPSATTAFLLFRTAARATYRVPKLVGREPETAEVERAFKTELKARESLDGVLDALRLFKDTRIDSPGVIQVSDDWTAEGRFTYAHRSGAGQSFPGSDPYRLAAEENDSLQEFFRATQVARRKKFLDNAVRRFGYAVDRQRVDDRLVDLLVSAEALYLNDVGPRERGELGYRLALRAARFIESEEHPRGIVFDLMRQAYGARSAIVHGSMPKGGFRNETGDSVTLEEFTALVESVQRAGLRRGIEAMERNDFPDWHALVLDLPTDGAE